jgi:hypothetical protein
MYSIFCVCSTRGLDMKRLRLTFTFNSGGPILFLLMAVVQVALISSYVSKSTELAGEEVDVALIDIEKRERVAWHAEMIFYTGMFAVMQSLVCLPGLLTVIPFFKEGSLTSEGSLAVPTPQISFSD